MSDQQAIPEPVQPTSPAALPTRRKSNKTANLLLAVAGIVASAGIAFAAGRFTAPATAAAPGGNGGFGNFPGPGGSFDPGNFPGGQGGPGQGGFGGLLDGATLSGEVTAVTDDTITLELENGSTIDIPTDDSTDYQAATESTPTEVVVGSNVLVRSSDVSFNPGAGPDASFDPTTGQPQASFGPAEQVIVLSE